MSIFFKLLSPAFLWFPMVKLPLQLRSSYSANASSFLNVTPVHKNINLA